MKTTYREIEQRTMTPEKKAIARNDYFAFYVGRPMSYLLTIPLIHTSITPNQISLLSILVLVCGFALIVFSSSIVMFVIGWLLFFLWNLLDGVDGNIARYKKIFSKYGEIYDAMSGYLAMFLTYFAVGIIAAKTDELITLPQLLPEHYMVLGALSGFFVVFPRLIMHKIISTNGSMDTVMEVKDKSSFSLPKTIALNLTSVTGFAQVTMLLAILFNLSNIYTILYFLVNILIMLVSLRKMLRE